MCKLERITSLILGGNLIRLILLLVVAALLITGWYVGTQVYFDDLVYDTLALQMLNGTYNVTRCPWTIGLATKLTECPYSYSSLLISTVAVSYKVLGNPNASISGWVITNGTYTGIHYKGDSLWVGGIPTALEFIALVVVLYVLCRRFFSPNISFLATLSLEISPFVFAYATRVLPDILLGLLASLTVLIIAYKKDSEYSYWWLLLAGLIAGSSIAVKFGGAAFFVFIPIAYFIAYRKSPHIYRNTLGMVLGIIIAVGVYQITLPVSISSALQVYSSYQSGGSVATLFSNAILPLENFNYFLVPNPAIYQVYPLGMAFFYTIFGLILAFKSKDTNMKFFAILFLISYLYLLFGTESVSHYQFIQVVNRYYIWFVAYFVILIAFFYKWAFARTKHPLMLLIVLVVLLFLSNYPYYLMFHMLITNPGMARMW